MSSESPQAGKKATPSHSDFYVENGLLVYTAAYHLKRGYCCGSGCRHCPYEPRHVEGNTLKNAVVGDEGLEPPTPSV